MKKLTKAIAIVLFPISMTAQNARKKTNYNNH
jgi:hypothetical protein